MKMTQLFVLCVAASLSSALMQAQPPGPPKPPGAEERLKHVTEKMEKDLQLTKVQKDKLVAAFKVFFTDMDKLRSIEKPPPPPPPPPANKEAADKLVKERDGKIKQALTDDQFKKYLELEKQLRPGRHGTPGREGPPPSHT